MLKTTKYLLPLLLLAMLFTACGSSSSSSSKIYHARPGINVTPSSGLVTSEDGIMNTISVSLNTAPSADVTIMVESLDLTEVTVSHASLIFNSTDWNVPQPVTLTGVNDDMADGNQVVSFTLDPQYSTDTTYSALAMRTFNVTNADNDAAGITVSKASVSVSEDLSTDSFTVMLNTQPASGQVVIVDVTSADTGEADVDQSTLTFTDSDWNFPQPVTVTGVDDLMADGNQTFDITLVVDGAATTADEYDAVIIPAVSCTNSDNDTADFTVSKASISVTESGGTDTFTVSPNTQPASGQVIVVTVESGDPTEASVDHASLTFTDSDWQTPQDVIVTGVDDVIIDGDQTFDITLTVDDPATTANEYDSVPIAPLTCTNTDEDTQEGTTSTPMNLTGLLPYSGTVDTSASYYVINGLTPGTSYVVAITSLTDNVDLYVYGGDSTFTTPATCAIDNTGNSGISQEYCYLTVTASDLYIMVDGSGTTAGATYYLDVVKSGDSGQGTVYNSTDPNLPLAIPDNNLIGASSTFLVTGATTNIQDVNVTVNITHTCDAELQISLFSPAGTMVPLSLFNGGCGNNYTGTVFDDEAFAAISLGSAPFNASFQSEFLELSSLDGENANGLWTLNVADNQTDATGTIDSWSLEIQ